MPASPPADAPAAQPQAEALWFWNKKEEVKPAQADAGTDSILLTREEIDNLKDYASDI